MHTKNKGQPKKNNKTQAYSTPSCFWYAYAIIGLEINIRLDLISNVCINIPGIKPYCRRISRGFEPLWSHTPGGCLEAHWDRRIEYSYRIEVRTIHARYMFRETIFSMQYFA